MTKSIRHLINYLGGIYMKTAALRRTDKSQFRKESFWARLKKNVVQNKGLYIMLIPVVAYYLIFHYEPMYGLQIAFKDFSFKKGILGSPWEGSNIFKISLAVTIFGAYWGIPFVSALVTCSGASPHLLS